MEILIFIGQFILFLLAIFTCFWIPGFYLLNKTKVNLTYWERLILSGIIGFSLFTLLGYILIVLNLKLLIIPFILGLIIINFSSIRSEITSFNINWNKQTTLILFIFILGIIGQLAIISPSGIFINGNLSFWSAHGHDSMWHIALTNELMNGYPIQSPNISENRLINYHFFSDIAPAYFTYFLKLDPLHLYFRFFPLLFSIFLGSTAFILGSRLFKTFYGGLWSTIFTYFAGSFGFIVTYLKDHTIGGESIFWISQTQSSIGNPPQIISIFFVLAFLILFINFLKNGLKDKYLTLILIVLAGTLVEFKVYAGVVLLISLGVVSFWEIITQRSFNTFITTLISGLLSLAIYLPNSASSVGFLIFEPWWYIRTMVVVPDRLNWLDLELKRQTYLSEHNYKRVYQLETEAFFIYLFGNLGMRFIGLIELVKQIRHFFSNSLYQLISLIIVISFVLPLLFLQKGVASNTIQFAQYFLVLMGILSAVTVSKILNRLPLFMKIFLSLSLITLMVPTQIGLIYNFYQRPPVAQISSTELQALTYLKNLNKPQSIVLNPMYNKYFITKAPTPPIWAWFDTSYIPAITGMKTYFSDFEQADIMGYPISDRQNFQDEIFKEDNPVIFSQKLKNKHIDYLYFPDVISPTVDLSKTDLKKVFENSEYQIWKVY